MSECFYILSAHWDREFYSNLEQYRLRLARLFDSLLEGWRSGELEGPFYLDGQFAPVEDYLEVAPERAGEVGRRMREGKLVTGPWYTMPDLFLVSGESLIRNLEMGMAETRRLGAEPSKVANCCDTFGFTGQLPQILASFGVELALMWRGSNCKEKRNLWWRGVDGSRILAFRFGLNTYWHYAVQVRRVHEEDHRLDAESFGRLFEAFYEFERARTDASAVFLFDGMDHGCWDRKAYGLLKGYRGRKGAPVIRHVSPDDYAALLRGEASTFRAELEGELREPGYREDGPEKQSVLQGTLSFRRNVKEANARCESLLIHWAEPFHAMAVALGMPSRSGFLRLAWKALLQNHAHDSICGSVTDAAMPDIEQRFERAREIAEQIASESLEHAGIGLLPEPEAADELGCLLANPGSSPACGIRRIRFWVPEAMLRDEKGDLRGWALEDGTRARPVEVIGREPKSRLRTFDAIGKEPRVSAGALIEALVDVDLPALGLRGYRLRARAKPAARRRHWDAAPESGVLENERLRIEVSDTGNVSMTDKDSGQAYRGLFRFEAEADGGSPFHFDPPENACRIHSAGSFVGSSLVHASSLGGILRLRYALTAPIDFMRAEEGETCLGVSVELSLFRGDAWARALVSVKNASRRYRLSALFPTDADASEFVTGNAFDAVHRPIETRGDLERLVEPWHETAPMHGWIAACGGKRGLAVLAPGIYEGGVRDDRRRTLSLVLLRNGNLFKFADGGLKGADCLGEWTFGMALRPLAGGFEPCELAEEARVSAAGLRALTFEGRDFSRLPAQAGEALGDTSLIQLEGSLVLSSCRLVGDAVEIRVYNPSEDEARGRLTLGDALSACDEGAECTLDGRPLGAWRAIKGAWDLRVGPKRIASQRFRSGRDRRSREKT